MPFLGPRKTTGTLRTRVLRLPEQCLAYLWVLLVDLAALGSAGLGSRPETLLGLLVPERKKTRNGSVQVKQQVSCKPVIGLGQNKPKLILYFKLMLLPPHNLAVEKQE